MNNYDKDSKADVNNFLLISSYIHENEILATIYNDAVKKFLPKASKNIIFIELCNYAYKKLKQKKQPIYDHVIYIVKEVCQKVGEDFQNGIDMYAPCSKNYRDIYFSIYNI